VGTAITATTAFTATNFTGDVVYSLGSRLPPGLSMADTGVISGTPTEAQSATTYTVTGEDRSGNSATATVSITVASASAALSPASQTVNGTVGTAITATTAFTATNFTGDVVYSLGSRLPPGLSMADTGVISGTPTEAQSATTYTVTGEDRSGNSATATVSITVASCAQPRCHRRRRRSMAPWALRSPRQRRLPPQTLRETWSTA
jgi:predicted amino acid-binding ACT domain protein